jgi:PAS domain S-box-containing protein
VAPSLERPDSVAALADAVIVTDAAGLIIEANPVAERMFGYSHDELLALRVESLMPAAFRESHEAQRSAYLASGHRRRMGQTRPFPALRRDGQHLLVEIDLRLRAAGPGPACTVAVIRDVTARERVIAEIGGDRERLRALTTGAFDLLWEATFEGDDGDGTLQMFRDLGPDLGYELGDFPRTLRITQWLAQMPAEDAAAFEEACRSARTSGKGIVTEYRMRTKSGGLAWFEHHGQPVEFVDGTPVKYLGASRNITKRKEAEESLRLANDELKRLKGELEDENVALVEEIERVQGFDEIVGASAGLKQVLRQVEQVAQSDASVLITGETGTGKELIAHAIHKASPRCRQPLVTINCAALPPTLIESELFGHERGAFTGAASRRLGRFELANRGTIFLDEIGELPLDLQSKLLRVLESGECQRVGSSDTFRVDVRVLAATNRRLDEEIEKGTFRLDLFYRLSVFPIEVPPLRERREDIPVLVSYLVGRKAARIGKVIDRVPREVIDRLTRYDWPGNVRELENVIERAVILSAGPVLTLSDALGGFPGRPTLDEPGDGMDTADQDWSLERAERTHLVRVCTACGWKVKGPGGAAERLGLNASTLYFRLKKLGIERPRSDG